MLSNINTNSIEAYNDIEDKNFDDLPSLITRIVQLLGAPTVDEIRQYILERFPVHSPKGKDEIGARCADTWRIFGAICQTGDSRISKYSGKAGATWQYVAEPFRRNAIAAYWKQRTENLEKNYENAKTKLEKERRNVK